ncbi:MAG: chemotaxis protein CheW [Rubripirellula sp.]|nr:chemotaxis protein CheW [Rubripirellula sp.]
MNHEHIVTLTKDYIAMQDAELICEFVEEAQEHLGGIEMQLLQVEALGADINDDLVNTVFRAIHSIKGAAGFLSLVEINKVAHRLENVLGKVREHQLVPDPYNVDVMLKAADRLRKLIESVDSSNDTDNGAICDSLDSLLTKSDAAPSTPAVTQEIRVEEKVLADESSSPNADAIATPDDTSERAEATLATIKTEIDKQVNESGTTPKSSGSPKAASSKAKGSASNSRANSSDTTIRVGVRVLDRLMNLAGELVLSRNQLLRVLGEQSTTGSNIDVIVSGLDQVTTELQETIMQTRMQPIGNVFNKFPRVIRDLSASLGKNITLKMEGTEVETDKTIVEAIADPLTHLVRNSCDHGIETPQVRAEAGKPDQGTVILRAFHKAGKVMIEILDDGGGMDPKRFRANAIKKGVLTEEAAKQMSDQDAVNLIFAPGFSTAASVTSVSGRGVGMDVVRTNIENIGGSVEVESKRGLGSTIRITLPLTLAIVPSMIVSVNDQPYALPQANIVELVQTGGQEKRIETVSNSEVLRLRGSLIPLFRLHEALSLRASSEVVSREESQLVVLEAGRSRFAVAVDRVLDSEEIVVKPLGRHLKNLPLLAGSTILGDGRVAMILDAAGIASRMAIVNESDSPSMESAHESMSAGLEDKQRMVLFSLSEHDHFAVTMDIVSRIERVRREAFDSIGDRQVLQYRGGTLQLLEVNEAIPVKFVDETEHLHVIVFKVCGHEVGLIAPHLNDIRDCDISRITEVSGQNGTAGVTVIENRTTRILDLYGITESARPEWFARFKASAEKDAEQHPLRILICEDSPFFLGFLTRTLKGEGHQVTACEDGAEGWEVLVDEANEFDLLLTDVEMPVLDGLALTKRVRDDARLRDLPVIALTSLADLESIQRGQEAGVNDYQVKMNKPELLASILRLTVEVR